MKRVGPELKMPDLKNVKVPAFLSDLFYDLRDRRLLPLVGLILVAIFAMPFLLRGEAGETEPAPGVGAAPAESAPTSRLTVVEAQPGLRDYRKRLAERTPTDPFKQRFSGPARDALPNSESSSSTSTSSGGSETEASPTAPSGSVVPVEPAPAPEYSPPSGGSSGSDGGEDIDGDGVPDGANLYTYVLDLQITRIETKPNGRREKVGPKLRKDVKSPTALPGEKAPVVTYLGLGAKEPRRPLFLVSPDVTSVFGEAECVSGTDSCQLVALEPGFPVTFVYGENNVRYKINLLDIRPEQVDPPK
jgi:hypothetical protein